MDFYHSVKQLFWAVDIGSIDILKSLIKQKNAINLKRTDGVFEGYTLLMYACTDSVKKNRSNTVQFLLENGADINVCLEDQIPPTIKKTPVSLAYNTLLNAHHTTSKEKNDNGLVPISLFSEQLALREEVALKEIESAFNMLLAHARKKIFAKSLQLIKTEKVEKAKITENAERTKKIDINTFSDLVKTCVLDLAGQNSITFQQSNPEKTQKNFVDLQNILIREVFNPIWDALQKRDAVLFSFYSGNHPKLGKNSPLTWLFKSPIYDRHLVPMILDYANIDINPFHDIRF